MQHKVVDVTVTLATSIVHALSRSRVAYTHVEVTPSRAHAPQNVELGFVNLDDVDNVNDEDDCVELNTHVDDEDENTKDGHLNPCLVDGFVDLPPSRPLLHTPPAHGIFKPTLASTSTTQCKTNHHGHQMITQ